MHVLPHAEPDSAPRNRQELRDREDGSATFALRLTDVSIRYRGAARPAVDGVSLQIEAGRSVGLLGESGCGKSSLARFATGLLPASASTAGSVELEGRALRDPADWRGLRGSRVGVVFQQPSLALHPMRRAGSQVVDVLRAHRRGSSSWCRERAAELFEELDLAPELLRAFPHQLSGGQQQRVVLAQALACEPGLLVADEPTTALDRETERQVLQLVDRVRRRRGMSLFWISHDPRVLAEVADTLYVMYAGRFMEQGPVHEVLKTPDHPYTRALIDCAPRRTARLHEPLSRRRLPELPGDEGSVPPEGCPFRARCPHQAPICRDELASRAGPSGERTTWCVRPEAAWPTGVEDLS